MVWSFMHRTPSRRSYSNDLESEYTSSQPSRLSKAILSAEMAFLTSGFLVLVLNARCLFYQNIIFSLIFFLNPASILWCKLVAEETSAAAVFDKLRSVANWLMRGVCPPASELAADLRQIQERIWAAGDILCATVAEPSAVAELYGGSREGSGGGAWEERMPRLGV
jgi:hypothetical protein